MSASVTAAKRQRHTALFEAMAERLGLLASIDAKSPEAAINRCTGCSHASACAHWLATTETAQSSPDYCENTSMFEALKHDIEAEGAPAR